MINQEHMQQWIDALRSGEYRKAVLLLEMGLDGQRLNCAEGVACREALKDGVELRVMTGRNLGYPGVEFFTVFDGLGGSLPAKVQDWLGLGPDEMAWIKTDQGLVDVAYANDELSMSFAEIADGLYEQYLKGPRE